MPKKVKISNPVFNKKKDKEIKPQFNLVTKTNSFNAVFDLQSLEKHEELQLENLLQENWLSEVLSTKKNKENLLQLKALTSEIKAISKQGSFLIGERVSQVRSLLKLYRDRTFTSWLEIVFGSRKTGYNFLGYYELFQSLPEEELRNKYKSMPQKAAYILATRKGNLEQKIEIIKKFGHLKNKELINIVKEKFACRDIRYQKTISSLLFRLSKVVDDLSSRGSLLTKEDVKVLGKTTKKLEKLLKEQTM